MRTPAVYVLASSASPTPFPMDTELNRTAHGEPPPVGLTAEWLEMVDSDPAASILHDPSFTSTWQETYRCRCIPAVVMSERGATGVLAWEIHSLFGRKIASQPFAFWPPLMGVQDSIAAMRHMVGEAQRRGPKWYVKFKSTTPLAASAIEPLGPIARVSPIVDSWLDLPADEDAQLARYSKGFRQNLRTSNRRAAEAGFVLRKAENERDVRGFYDVLCRLNRDKHRMISHPLGLYLKLFRRLSSSGNVDFYLAERAGRVVAGTLLLRHRRRWTYAWGAADQDLHRFGLNTLIVDMMIGDAIRAGATVMEFGSSHPAEEALMYFKGRWGCQHRPVHYHYWNHQPNAVDTVNGMGPVRSLIRFTPLGIIQAMAPWVVPLLA